MLQGISKCILAETHMHPIETFLKLFQIVSQPKFCWILLKRFEHVSKMCFSWKSIASFWNFSKTFSKCILAEIRLHCIEIFLRILKAVSRPNSNCNVPKLFYDLFKKYHDQNSIASYRIFSKTFSKYLLAEFQLQCTKRNERHFQIVS